MMSDMQTWLTLIGWKASLILGIVSVATWIARRHWPRGGAVWQRIGIVALLALPICVGLAPSIEIPVLAGPQTPSIVADGTQTSALVRFDLPPAAPTHISAWPAEPIGFSDVFDALEKQEAVRPITVGSSSDRPKTVRDSRSPRSVLMIWLGIAYVLVSSALAGRIISSWIGLIRLKRSAINVVQSEWQSALTQWSGESSIRRPVQLLASAEISVPMTFGWISPVILVPLDCLSTCDSKQRDAILIHELIHIARGDFLWQLLTHLATAIYWVHPLIWLVRRESAVLHERVCDLLCAGRLGRELYSRALIEIAARSQKTPSFGLGMSMAQRHSLRRRLEDLRFANTSDVQHSGRASAALVCAVAALVLGAVVVGLVTEQSSSELKTAESKPSASVAATVNSPAIDSATAAPYGIGIMTSDVAIDSFAVNSATVTILQDGIYAVDMTAGQIEIRGSNNWNPDGSILQPVEVGLYPDPSPRDNSKLDGSILKPFDTLENRTQHGNLPAGIGIHSDNGNVTWNLYASKAAYEQIEAVVSNSADTPGAIAHLCDKALNRRNSCLWPRIHFDFNGAQWTWKVYSSPPINNSAGVQTPLIQSMSEPDAIFLRPVTNVVPGTAVAE